MFKNLFTKQDNGAVPVNIKSPLELNGGIPVNLQDQTTRAIIANFNQVTNSTDLAIDAAQKSYTITPTDTTGFVAGRYIILFHPSSKNFSFYKQIGDPAAGVVTLDTPLDFSYPAGTFVDTSTTALDVDGSSAVQTFGLRGTGAPPGVDITVDITRLIFACTAASAIDLAKFGDLTALARGLVLRRRNDRLENIFNVKTNGQIAGIMYDYDDFASTNPSKGVDGFTSRLTFGGQNKIGVVQRLEIGEDLEILVQDDLRGLTSLEIIAEGHIVTN